MQQKAKIWTALVLLIMPIIFGLIMMKISSSNRELVPYGLWILQPMIFIGIPSATGLLLHYVATKRKNQALANAIRVTFFIIVAILGSVTTLPGIIKKTHEIMLEIGRPSDQEFKEIIASFLPKYIPGSKIGNTITAIPDDQQWSVSTDACVVFESRDICAPVIVVMTKDLQVVGANFDFDRMKQLIENTNKGQQN